MKRSLRTTRKGREIFGIVTILTLTVTAIPARLHAA